MGMSRSTLTFQLASRTASMQSFLSNYSSCVLIAIGNSHRTFNVYVDNGTFVVYDFARIPSVDVSLCRRSETLLDHFFALSPKLLGSLRVKRVAAHAAQCRVD